MHSEVFVLRLRACLMGLSLPNNIICNISNASFVIKYVCFGCTVQEVWSCWMELLQYLDMEQNWLNTLQEKVETTENLPESTEAVNKALEVHRHVTNRQSEARFLAWNI